MIITFLLSISTKNTFSETRKKLRLNIFSCENRKSQTEKIPLCTLLLALPTRRVLPMELCRQAVINYSIKFACICFWERVQTNMVWSLLKTSHQEIFGNKVPKLWDGNCFQNDSQLEKAAQLAKPPTTVQVLSVVAKMRKWVTLCHKM